MRRVGPLPGSSNRLLHHSLFKLGPDRYDARQSPEHKDVTTEVEMVEDMTT